MEIEYTEDTNEDAMRNSHLEPSQTASNTRDTPIKSAEENNLKESHLKESNSQSYTDQRFQPQPHLG